MPTKNSREQISFDPHMVALLNELAVQEHKTLSNLAKELILEALERREDMELSTLAALRDKEVDDLVEHDDAWK